ncbi:Fe-S protein assembly co-chaperone HscB [Granulicella cerasi]|uniref:Fe-S protein assembly co-chaperone HscB n=1 Tax=Granulicella cerasi TaxID=741063 RepID=A0ABW1Z9F2_9BACT|nr:Fe-S protein assembly co-chaperone HscB [Granulicella cerasi]
MTNSPDYFSLFDLPRHLNIDLQALEKTFYAQSRRLHPDRFAAKPAEEQEAALVASSRLNDAYRTLKDPVARTEYLLSLEGVQMEEQSRAATDAAKASGTAKKQVAPPDLLEEAFELNMQLEEMRMNKKMGEDDPQVRADLEGARERFTKMLKDLEEKLRALWTEWDNCADAHDDAGKTTARDAMVALLNRRSYARNLVRDVNEALE